MIQARFRVFISCAWVGALCSATIAAEPITLGEVVVTATAIDGVPETGEVDRELTPAFHRVVERESFEGKVEDLGQVLEREAAIQVRQTGGAGSFSTLSIRGSSSDQVMIYLDGILLNDASGGGVDLSTLSLSDVEQVEIYKGVTPVNFGRASIGGAVNIRTLRAEPEFSGSVSAGYGSFDTRKLTALVNHRLERWDYLISAEQFASENDYEIVNDNGTKWNPDDDRTEPRYNAAFRQTNLLGKLGVDLSPALRVTFLDQWFRKKQGLPTRNNNALADTSLTTNRNITALALTADDVTPLHLNTRTTIDLVVKEELYDDSQGHVGLGKQKMEYRTVRYGANLFAEWFGEWQVLSLLADGRRETFRSSDQLGAAPNQESSRNTLTAAVQDSLLLFDEALIVTPALRYTRIHDQLDSAAFAGDPGSDDNRRDRGYVTPQLGLRWHLTSNLTVKSNLSRYVREPSFFELFGDRGYFLGNPDLRAEEGLNGDVGLEVKRRLYGTWLQSFTFEAAYFHTLAKNLITRVYDARGIGQSQNISEARIRGIESTVGVELLRYLRLSGNATLQDTENRSEIQAFNGKELPGRWRTSYLTRLEARLRSLQLSVEVLIEKGLYYDTANLLQAEDKRLVNAGLSWGAGPVLLTLEANNLTDDRYEDIAGYPMPGRNYFANLKLFF